jgi:hypothetical protein
LRLDRWKISLCGPQHFVPVIPRGESKKEIKLPEIINNYVFTRLVESRLSTSYWWCNVQLVWRLNLPRSPVVSTLGSFNFNNNCTSFNLYIIVAPCFEALTSASAGYFSRLYLNNQLLFMLQITSQNLLHLNRKYTNKCTIFYVFSIILPTCFGLVWPLSGQYTIGIPSPQAHSNRLTLRTRSRPFNSAQFQFALSQVLQPLRAV